MTWIHAFWAIAGLVVGVLHAKSLRHSSQRVTSLHAAVGMLRLLIVAAVLVGAALSGGLLPAASGWAVGFAGLVGSYSLRARWS